MIYQVNEYFLPYIMNGLDCAGEMTEEECAKCDKFAEDNLNGGHFSYFEHNSELFTNFDVCEICGEMSQVVFLYTDPEDVNELKSRFFIES